MARQPDLTPTGVLETPYLRAQAVWDARIGSARRQAHTWQLLAFGLLLVSGGLVGGLVYQSSKAQVVPYVVEVDTQGQVRTVGPAQVAYVPSRAAIQKQLSDFVRDIRALPVDPIVMRQQWLRAYAVVTPRGGAMLTELNRQQNPFDRLGQQMVTVDVTRALPVTDTSFDVQWTETTYDARGTALATEHYSGIFRVQLRQPQNEKELRANPLGIFVDTFSWSRK